MIELIQFPWSPYCIVQRRILEFANIPFKIVDIPPSDRSLVWKLTRERYYAVPIIKDGKTVVFETDDNSQVIAKYLDGKLGLNLFPRAWEGVQNLLWRYFENDVEAVGFKLNDIYFKEFVPATEQLAHIRQKERKFGRGCIEQWRKQQKQLLVELERRLMPCEEMLFERPFLLSDRPLFVDFNLAGVLDNFLYCGHHKIPARCKRLRAWHARMGQLIVKQ
jgi:glutathione S-transferase